MYLFNITDLLNDLFEGFFFILINMELFLFIFEGCIINVKY